MRKEIETLAIWYIPVCIAALILNVLMISTLEHSFAPVVGEGAPLSIGLSFSSFMRITTLIGFGDNLVVGVWLFFQAKRRDGRKALWFLFGLFAHLFAAIIYIGLTLFEQERASDISLKRDAL
jgi:hypothetical protein